MIHKRNRMRDWTEFLLSEGRFTFMLDEVRAIFPETNDDSVRTSLHRLSNRGRVISIFRGFYIIIPPQYSKMGVLPPELFVDQLMGYLKRRYYVGLLNAAQNYGSSHQSPQETFVFTGFPSLRDTVTAGIRIRYISRSLPSGVHLRKIKTESGYLTTSSPVLTMLDLVQFQHRIGGMNRVATVIAEMAENESFEIPDEELVKATKISVLQRLGFIFDTLGLDEAAGLLFERLRMQYPKFQKTVLNPSKPKDGAGVDPKWNVIINTKIEPDI